MQIISVCVIVLQCTVTVGWGAPERIGVRLHDALAVDQMDGIAVLKQVAVQAESVPQGMLSPMTLGLLAMTTIVACQQPFDEGVPMPLDQTNVQEDGAWSYPRRFEAQKGSDGEGNPEYHVVTYVTFPNGEEAILTVESTSYKSSDVAHARVDFLTETYAAAPVDNAYLDEFYEVYTEYKTEDEIEENAHVYAREFPDVDVVTDADRPVNRPGKITASHSSSKNGHYISRKKIPYGTLVQDRFFVKGNLHRVTISCKQEKQKRENRYVFTYAMRMVGKHLVPRLTEITDVARDYSMRISYNKRRLTRVAILDRHHEEHWYIMTPLARKGWWELDAFSRDTVVHKTHVTTYTVDMANGMVWPKEESQDKSVGDVVAFDAQPAMLPVLRFEEMGSVAECVAFIAQTPLLLSGKVTRFDEIVHIPEAPDNPHDRAVLTCA